MWDEAELSEKILLYSVKIGMGSGEECGGGGYVSPGNFKIFLRMNRISNRGLSRGGGGLLEGS